ncbi:MAG: tetratricopeptide repeat protein [Termitinemataceae bacterium]|nr:MAG: tetratricopeptide repeat protein [Termitinemataceae bacterium]
MQTINHRSVFSIGIFACKGHICPPQLAFARLKCVIRSCGFIFFFCALIFCLSAQNRDVAYYYNQGRESMSNEDWYSATEDFLECIKINPSYAGAHFSLAECYYELAEYDEALNYVRGARRLARLDMNIANLEASILIAVGNLAEAEALIKEVQSRQPYNREALFAAAELDIARGKSGDAVRRYREAIRLFPDDRRLLVSLALVLGSLGDIEQAQNYIERAKELHSDDYRVFYYDAYLQARAGKINLAIANAKASLELRPSFLEAQSLLASLRYRANEFAEASALADKIINVQPKKSSPWFLKGMAQARLGHNQDARSAFERAISIDKIDEFARTALEDLIIKTTNLEDSSRVRPALWHFDRAEASRKQNLFTDALFEYRRGLRINPYADQRLQYAEILKLQGYPKQYLAELEFIQGIGKSTREINNAVEIYSQQTKLSIFNRWKIEPVELTRPWNIAVFSVANQSAFYHTDAGYIAASYLKDILVHSQTINALDLETRQASFSTAFRNAREGEKQTGRGADYFLVLSIKENDRDIAIKGELFVARTGSSAAVFNVYRAGSDKLRNAVINIAAQLEAALPYRGTLLRRQADIGLIDRGKLNNIQKDTVFQIIKKDKIDVESHGIMLKYLPQDVLGTFIVNEIDEEVSTGKIARSGFFDLIGEGDEIIIPAEKTAALTTAAQNTADPELRTMLRTLR